MIPQVFEFLESIPLNSNGKIDRFQLKLQAITCKIKTQNCANCMKSLCIFQSWENVNVALLEFFQKFVSGSDALTQSFFDNGLDSLFFAHLCSFVRLTFGRSISARDLSHFDSISSLACFLETGQSLLSSAAKHDVIQQDKEMPMNLPRIGLQTSETQSNFILLTGCTGFVGCFLLDALKVHNKFRLVCLVRASSNDEV
jgi:hypothetical protein